MGSDHLVVTHSLFQDGGQFYQNGCFLALALPGETLAVTAT
jgi:hypothetical protein